MLIEHRGEAEYDFRHSLHASYSSVVREDADEALRLVNQLLRDTGSRLWASVVGWDQPVSTEAFLLASIYTAWSGKRHPLIPDESEQAISEVEMRLADMALENMNRR